MADSFAIPAVVGYARAKFSSPGRMSTVMVEAGVDRIRTKVLNIDIAWPEMNIRQVVQSAARGGKSWASVGWRSYRMKLFDCQYCVSRVEDTATQGPCDVGS